MTLIGARIHIHHRAGHERVLVTPYVADPSGLPADQIWPFQADTYSVRLVSASPEMQTEPFRRHSDAT